MKFKVGDFVHAHLDDEFDALKGVIKRVDQDDMKIYPYLVTWEDADGDADETWFGEEDLTLISPLERIL